jgi:hypothetical protein
MISKILKVNATFEEQLRKKLTRICPVAGVAGRKDFFVSTLSSVQANKFIVFFIFFVAVGLSHLKGLSYQFQLSKKRYY